MSNLVKIIPAELHLEIVQGDDLRLSIDFDFDITGYTITSAIKPKAGGDEVALAIENKVDAAGTLDVVLADTASALLPAAYHSWYFLMQPTGGDRRTFFHGRFIVKER